MGHPSSECHRHRGDDLGSAEEHQVRGAGAGHKRRGRRSLVGFGVGNDGTQHGTVLQHRLRHPQRGREPPRPARRRVSGGGHRPRRGRDAELQSLGGGMPHRSMSTPAAGNSAPGTRSTTRRCQATRSRWSHKTVAALPPPSRSRSPSPTRTTRRRSTATPPPAAWPRTPRPGTTSEYRWRPRTPMRAKR